MMAIKTIIYEDNNMLREALSFLIEGTEGFELVGSFDNCIEVLAQVKKNEPDVILMDIDLPGMSGIEAVRSIKKRFSYVDVLMLTVFDDDERVFESIKAGATGYLLKKTSPARILEAIREVFEGGAPMSPSIARRVMQNLHERPSTVAEISQLSKRELEVLRHLVEGKSYKMVADSCGITIETVRTHIKRIYEKLQVHSVTEAVAKYNKR
ncbi:response regulator [Emticicia soli]|uniref:Response regulator n=1 Tax=Emticicia soli TaxID=2027878 RepID=A0ABW5J3J3_9BACT